MSRKKVNPSEADLRSSIYSWVDKTDKPPRAEVDIVPEGWMTMEQMAEHKNVPVTTMYSRVARHLKAGTIQKKKFFVRNGRFTQDINHYFTT
jgi:hypothetical protein